MASSLDGLDIQEPFFVALGRNDLKQRNDFPGLGQSVGDQRQMRQFSQFS
jgi:hypothetical protein